MEQLEKQIGNKCVDVSKSTLLECQNKSNDNNKIHFVYICAIQMRKW